MFWGFFLVCFVVYFISSLVCFLSGKIDAAEIRHSLHTVGVSISLEEANRILQRSPTLV